MARLLSIIVSFVIFPDRIHYLVKPDITQLPVWSPFPAGETLNPAVVDFDRKDVPLDAE